MAIVKDQETVNKEQAVDFDKSPLASALFRHIEQYYAYPRVGVTKTLDDIEKEVGCR